MAVYRLTPKGTLETVRAVTDDEGGNLQVVMSEDALYVVYPYYDPANVSIIHLRRPEEEDVVPLDVGSNNLDESQMIVAKQRLNEPAALIVRLFSSDQAGILYQAGDLSVSSAPRDGISRVTPVSTPRLVDLQFLGTVSDPSPTLDPVVWIKNGAVRQAVVDNIIYAPAPNWLVESYASPSQGGVGSLVACTRRYIVLDPPLYPAEKVVGEVPKGKQTLNVFDIAKQEWRRLLIDGDRDYTARIFDDWLAVREESGKGSGPGGGSMRLPGYPDSVFTGRLLLVNLRDNRALALQTSSADCEIIDVSGEEVLYRVANTIYQTHIAGKSFTPGKKVVQGELVPLVHWVVHVPTSGQK